MTCNIMQRQKWTKGPGNILHFKCVLDLFFSKPVRLAVTCHYKSPETILFEKIQQSNRLVYRLYRIYGRGTPKELGKTEKHTQHHKSVSKPLYYNISLDCNPKEGANKVPSHGQKQWYYPSKQCIFVSLGRQEYPNGLTH